MYNIVFKIMKKNERNLLTTTYIVKKKLYQSTPTPSRPLPFPSSTLFLYVLC